MTMMPEEIRTIERDKLTDKLERGDPIRVVMALNEWAFRAKHIPGSEHFNTPDDLLASLDPDEEIIVYCTSEDCESSIALYAALVRRRLYEREPILGRPNRLGERRAPP